MLEPPLNSEEIEGIEGIEGIGEIESQSPWFVSRMMMDNWHFGLLVTGDVVIVIESIDHIREHGGIVWLDVTMSPKNDFEDRLPGFKLMYSPTRRTDASIRADAVIAAFELADT